MTGRYHEKSIYEWLIYRRVKPPKILFVVFLIIIVGSAIFHLDFFYWWVKACNFLYIDKVIKFMSTVITTVIPK